MANPRPLISIVVPAYNEAACLVKLHEELRRCLDPLPFQFEFLFVDDGSSDATQAVLEKLRQTDSRVCYLALSRNFGHQAALSAGLDHARGDAVIMMDGDLQHPPEVIPQLLDCWQAGHDVVNTVRLRTQALPVHKRLLSSWFYRLFNKIANVQIEPGGADFRLMSRAAVTALNRLPERHRFLRGLVPWIGFRQTKITFAAPERWAGRSKYTFWRSLLFALDGMTSFSFYPLRRLTILGWVVALASCLYGMFALGAWFLGYHTAAGWTSLLLCVLFLGGCQLVLAGVLGEYLGRVLEQVKGRPLYIVQIAVGVAVGEHAAVPAGFLAHQAGTAFSAGATTSPTNSRAA
jgi:dolichol-phosphate mannosyltransferase